MLLLQCRTHLSATRLGDPTGGVVFSSPYLTAHLPVVIPTEIIRVVIMSGVMNVVRQHIIVVRVLLVQITLVYTESGKNPAVYRNGDMTVGVVSATPCLTLHLPSVTLMERDRVVQEN